jgi:hypothetical protein
MYSGSLKRNRIAKNRVLILNGVREIMNKGFSPYAAMRKSGTIYVY